MSRTTSRAAERRVTDSDPVITLAATTRIAAPPSAVIAFIADPANAPRWMKALEVAELITPGPIRPGSRFREVMSAGGKRVEAICEIVELDPDRRYAWQSVSGGPTTYGGGFTATPIEGGTELRYEGWATTSGELVRREQAWARQAQREAEAELAAIKSTVESAAP
jgi:uncharacterized protein YndB with AHSA1/START domain